MAAPMNDFLDAMMWSIAASGVLLGIAALRLHYKVSSDSIEEEQKNLATGLGVALGATGLYLFLTGIYIQFVPSPPSPFGSPYFVLFGGVSSLGGLVMLSVAAAFFLRRGLQACSYFAFVVGLYLISDAYSIYKYSLTSDPFKSTLLYLAPAVALLLSVPALHIQNRWSRVVFAIFAFIFAGAWFYFAATTTPTHLG
ncbi:MAG TPA: DUF981 family protein [Candidatus Acidoferrales bacterium]|nr:DUF981 family protein [Candidatus Acidoferrales bacterium]